MTKKTLYIHLGPAKTGTTAIQRFLSSNDRQLSEKGTHYIKALRCKDGSHNPLTWILYHIHFKMLLNIQSAPFVAKRDDLLKELAEELAGISEQSIVLSSEVIHLLSSEAIEEIINLFSDIQIKAIFYVRDFRELTLSLASQIVKLKDSNISDERISNIYDNHLNHSYKCYTRCLNTFADMIGKENFIFRKYGKQYFEGGNIYSDFLDILGIDLTDEFLVPDKLQNESLVYCETIYFKDMLNRLALKTPQDILAERLVEWEKSNKGTRFYLPQHISEKVEELAARFNSYLLNNYLDDTYRDFFSRTVLSGREPEYRLSYDTMINLIEYMDVHINNFKADFMESLAGSLDRTYDYELKLHELEEIFKGLIRDRKAIAFWGCGDIAEKLFRNYDFLRGGSFYIIDKNFEKQGNYFWGHKILPPSIISEKNIDAVIITSAKYATEISREVTENYPSVRYIIKLEGLSVHTGIECVDFKARGLQH